MWRIYSTWKKISNVFSETFEFLFLIWIFTNFEKEGILTFPPATWRKNIFKRKRKKRTHDCQINYNCYDCYMKNIEFFIVIGSITSLYGYYIISIFILLIPLWKSNEILLFPIVNFQTMIKFKYCGRLCTSVLLLDYLRTILTPRTICF